MPISNNDFVYIRKYDSHNLLSLCLYVLHLCSGWILIDRSGTYFGTIMNYLRDGTIVLPDSQKGIAELLAEAKYYCITELADTCERALRKLEPEPICRVPLITSQKEEQMLISNSSKVDSLSHWKYKISRICVSNIHFCFSACRQVTHQSTQQ